MMDVPTDFCLFLYQQDAWNQENQSFEFE